MSKKKVFNLKKYAHDQIVDALTCPLNRHATRVERQCDDFELHRHPDWLLEHYIRYGGAVHWATKRKEYEEEIEIPEEDYQI